jgi:lipopolysaccharide/colanic/teichoic acid biosynthesis glycosyltransferase
MLQWEASMYSDRAATLAQSRSQPVKRLMDVAIASALFILLLPILGLLLILVRLDSPGHPLFTQVRVGRHGRPYTIYKLRTFYVQHFGLFPAEEIRRGDHRVTRVGQWCRHRKVDELPQLLNVILGHMSLVGPRPDIPLQAQHYSETDRRRLLVRPGLTGIAQISGNTWLSWQQRIQLDQWYVEHCSLAVDIKILLHTLPVLLRGERADDDRLGLKAKLLSAGQSADAMEPSLAFDAPSPADRS